MRQPGNHAASNDHRAGSHAGRARRQHGVVSIEFAFIFPVLFLIFYAIVTYGLIFAAQQALSLAAAEGARASLRYQAAEAPPGPTATQKRLTEAVRAARAPLTWLDGMGGLAVPRASEAACSYNAAVRCVTVVVSYDYAAHPLIPNLLLPTPASLGSSAIAQVNPSAL